MTIERIEPDESVIRPKVGTEITPETPMEGIQRYLDEVRKACGAKLSTDKSQETKKGGFFNN